MNFLLERHYSKFITFVYSVLVVYFCAFFLTTINVTLYRSIFAKEKIILSFFQYAVYAFDKYIVLIGFGLYFFLAKNRRELQRQKEETLLAKNLAQQAQLEMLHYQLNPHFLFNALNTIRTVIYENKKQADIMITELSEILRYSLDKGSESEVLLKTELEMIKKYLNIQKLRFEEDLKITFSIDQTSENIAIPSFLIHPLVENAIKYGWETSQKPLTIEIEIQDQNEELIIQVVNSGKLVKDLSFDSMGTKTGIKNIKMRLDHFYPNQYSFDLFEQGSKVYAKIELQKEEKKNDSPDKSNNN